MSSASLIIGVDSVDLRDQRGRADSCSKAPSSLLWESVNQSLARGRSQVF
jgi:hypothetical protein